VRVLRPLTRELKQREEILDLIVGGEGGVQQRRQEQLAFAERVDYAVLLGDAGRRCEAEVSHRSEPV